MCPRGARMVTGDGSLLGAARLVCHCLLIEGAEGLVLVDTGFGLDDIANPRQLGRVFTAVVRPRLSRADAAITQICELGLDPHDVRHIITTHLDLDHAGGLPDFPEAEVHLLGRELEAAMNPGWRDGPRYVAAHWAHGPRWVQHDGGGEQWHGFDSVRVLPGSDAEILLIPLVGHSHGHTGVAIRRGGGRLAAALRRRLLPPRRGRHAAALPARHRRRCRLRPGRRRRPPRQRRTPARARRAPLGRGRADLLARPRVSRRALSVRRRAGLAHEPAHPLDPAFRVGALARHELRHVLVRQDQEALLADARDDRVRHVLRFEQPAR